MTNSVPLARPVYSDRLVVRALIVLSILPVVYIVVRGVLASRNVAYWDELDTALSFLLRLDSANPWQALDSFVALGNEHRTLTSRLLFAVSYWLTGTINFVAVGLIGNLFICLFCGLLIATAGSVERRVRMAVLLAALIFQLEHYENFLWSGASIDHFQVVLLAGAVFAGLGRGSRLGFLAAALCGLLATFTLAHGLAVWLVGAWVLAGDRRWRRLGLWLVLALVAGALFFQGFSLNSSHAIGDVSLGGFGRALHYWLTLLGAPLALGEDAIAPFIGIVLLALLGRLLVRGEAAGERVALPLAGWAVASLLLVAIGRAEVAHGQVYSRYYVLGALAWALVLFVYLETWRDPARPYRVLVGCTPLLVLFNVTASVRFADDARGWINSRDSATDQFMRFGRDGMGRHTLHPNPDHATAVLQWAEQAGVFRMPVACQERTFAEVNPAKRLAYSVDRIGPERGIVRIEGWAAIPGVEARGGETHVILQSTNSRFVFATLPIERNDVSAVHPGECWRQAGFRFQRRRWLLPREDFQIGLLYVSDRGAEFIMTSHRLNLSPRAEVDTAIVHPNGNRYDRIVLQGASATVTAAPGQVTRVSYLDLAETLVHVEFSGAGKLELRLDEASGPVTPRRYDQPRMSYMKGHASLVITGADQTTNLGVFSVRGRPAGGTALFGNREVRSGVVYLAGITIGSRNGKFGGIRAGNVNFCASAGITGIHAPGIVFNAPVLVGEICAADSAQPELLLGSAAEVRIAGGDLWQANGRPVLVSGISRLRLTDGATAHGERLPARRNRGRLEEGGRDVSARVVSYPARVNEQSAAWSD